MKSKTEGFTEEEIQTSLDNLNKGVKFVSVVEAAATTTTKNKEWKKLFEDIDKKGYTAKSYRWIHEGQGYESLEEKIKEEVSA